jgi:hypothetical protein
MCRRRISTEEEKRNNKVDNNYYCFYRGPAYAFKATDTLGTMQVFSNSTNTTLNLTK